MGYTLGAAARACGMSKTSILRSIKAGRISAGRDEFGQWAIKPCELHRVYPALTDHNDTANGTGERAATGGDTALVEAKARASRAIVPFDDALICSRPAASRRACAGRNSGHCWRTYMVVANNVQTGATG